MAAAPPWIQRWPCPIDARVVSCAASGRPPASTLATRPEPKARGSSCFPLAAAARLPLTPRSFLALTASLLPYLCPRSIRPGHFTPHHHHLLPHRASGGSASRHPPNPPPQRAKAPPAMAPAPAPFRRQRDAEAELNLPPGFRFHPTDEELVAHYLVARASGRAPPVPIIAEVDLYRFDPWELPPHALFGSREWYFFTPRDRKYPNGSRPNRAAGTGYWKATGADRPVAHGGRTVGIKKALVFYHGKPPRGVKTEWIMHEYRLPDDAGRKKPGNGSLRLDDWVLCRLYHKKNEWEKMQKKQQEAEEASQSQSQSFGDTRTPESEVDQEQAPPVVPKEEAQNMDGLGFGADDWLTGIDLDDMQGLYAMPGDDFFSSMQLTPTAAKAEQGGDAGAGAGAGFFF